MAIWLRLKSYILGAIAALAAIVSIYLTGRKHGARSEADQRDRADRDSARRIENAADRARHVTGDAVDRLRRQSRIRD